MNSASGAQKKSSVVVWIIVLILIIIGTIIFMKRDTMTTENPATEGMSQSTDKASLEADLNATGTVDNESSMQEVDKEFQ